MFTGLIQDVGTIEQLAMNQREVRITVKTALDHLQLGESIAVNGACLTVTEARTGSFVAYASAETLSRTGIGNLANRSRVNLERAVRVGDPLGGHIVTGHVDARTALLDRRPTGAAQCFAIALPVEVTLKKQIATKGSVTIDGVSLTVNEVYGDRFEVMVIPHTLASTTLADITPGTLLNLETDVLAKYIARQLEPKHGANDGVTLDLLTRAGFVR